MIKIDLIPEDMQLANLVSSLDFMSKKYLPNTYKAFKASVALVSYVWKQYAVGAPIKGSTIRLKNATGVYAKSIKTKTFSALHSMVYSDSPIATYLENGTKRYDMKKTHPFGNRSRVSKKGVAYLIIPFRHGIPGSKSYSNLPENVYNQIRAAVKKGDVVLSQRAKGRKLSPNYKGEIIPRANYGWGSRIKGTGFDNLEGLMVMNVSTPKSKRSEYVTFRVISAKNSPAMKWIVKARPGMHITKHVYNNTKGEIKYLIENGLKHDLGMV